MVSYCQQRSCPGDPGVAVWDRCSGNANRDMGSIARLDNSDCAPGKYEMSGRALLDPIPGREGIAAQEAEKPEVPGSQTSPKGQKKSALKKEKNRKFMLDKKGTVC